MTESFVVIDLISQGVAVEEYLRDRTTDEKLGWLAQQGRLTKLSKHEGFPQGYLFESRCGLQCIFFFCDDELWFLGDHYPFRPK